MITESEYLALPAIDVVNNSRWDILKKAGFDLDYGNPDNWVDTGAIIERMQELGFKFEINSIRGAIGKYDVYFCTSDESEYWNWENDNIHHAVQIAAGKALGVIG